MFQKIKRFIDKYGLIKKKDRLLVGLSGGPDSVFLLNTLLKFRNLYKLSVFACHIDHQYRRKSYKDAQFVKNICKNLKVPVEIRKIKLKKFTEEGARDSRYRIFKKCAMKFKCNKIATGHTLDDNAETVLMWIARGCGINGLKGIPPVRGKIIRPILCVSKKEITNYLKKNKINYCTDRTNFIPNFTRNRIRLKILPLFEKINPKINQHVFELGEKLRKKDIDPAHNFPPCFARNLTKSVKVMCGVDTSGKKCYNKKIRCILHEEGTAFFDADKLNIKKIKIKKWEPGDRMIPFGMSGSKKLQDIFTDLKIAKEVRKKIPIVTDSKKIIWVAGVKRSNDAKITDDTKKVLRMELINAQ